MEKNREAIRMMQEKKYEEAAKLFNEIIEENPNDPLGYINFGNLLVELQENERAERFFLKAIELDENAATAYYGLGNLYFEQNQFEQLQKIFSRHWIKVLRMLMFITCWDYRCRIKRSFV